MNSKAKHRVTQVTTAKGAAIETDSLPGDPPRQDEIAALAYSYWEARGYNGGSAEEDWLRAEEEVRKRHAQMRMPKDIRATAKGAAA
jgi:hypothetical protein